MTDLNFKSIPKMSKELAADIFDSYVDEKVSFIENIPKQEFIEISYLYDDDIHYQILKDGRVVGGFGLKSHHFALGKRIKLLTAIKNIHLIAVFTYIEERLKLGDLYISYLFFEPEEKNTDNLTAVLTFIEKLAKENGAFKQVCLDCREDDSLLVNVLLDRNYETHDVKKFRSKKWFYYKKEIVRYKRQ